LFVFYLLAFTWQGTKTVFGVATGSADCWKKKDFSFRKKRFNFDTKTNFFCKDFGMASAGNRTEAMHGFYNPAWGRNKLFTTTTEI